MESADQPNESTALLSRQKSKLRGGINTTMVASLGRISQLARERARLKKERGGRGHSFLYSLVNEHSHRTEAKWFQWILTTLIIMNVLAFILQSDQYLDRRFQVYWNVLEAASSILFLVEYVIRVYTRPESRKYAGCDANSARLQWMMTYGALVDLIAILPWFVEQISTVVVKTSGKGVIVVMPTLTWLRVLRLFRLLKSHQIMESIDVFRRVIYFNGDILLVAFILCMILLLILATLLFYLAPKGEELEEDFSSIPATMYLSVMMLTGQGQPAGTLPWYTKLICATTAIFAVAQFAIPASMLTWGFEQEAERRIRKRHDERQKKLDAIKCGRMQSHDYSSESSEGNSDDFTEDWKDYEHLVVGSDSDEEAGTPDKKRAPLPESGSLSAKEYARVLKIFSALDSGETGRIPTEELVKLKGLEGDAISTMLDPNGDGYTESHEFVEWLCKVKSSHEASVFEMLLKDLEDVRNRIVTGRSNISVASPNLPDQLIQFAEEFRSLQNQVAKLQNELLLKNQEIERLKQDTSVHTKDG